MGRMTSQYIPVDEMDNTIHVWNHQSECHVKKKDLNNHQHMVFNRCPIIQHGIHWSPKMLGEYLSIVWWHEVRERISLKIYIYIYNNIYNIYIYIHIYIHIYIYTMQDIYDISHDIQILSTFFGGDSISTYTVRKANTMHVMVMIRTPDPKHNVTESQHTLDSWGKYSCHHLNPFGCFSGNCLKINMPCGLTRLPWWPVLHVSCFNDNFNAHACRHGLFEVNNNLFFASLKCWDNLIYPYVPCPHV